MYFAYFAREISIGYTFMSLEEVVINYWFVCVRFYMSMLLASMVLQIQEKPLNTMQEVLDRYAIIL